MYSLSCHFLLLINEMNNCWRSFSQLISWLQLPQFNKISASSHIPHHWSKAPFSQASCWGSYPHTHPFYCGRTIKSRTEWYILPFGSHRQDFWCTVQCIGDGTQTAPFNSLRIPGIHVPSVRISHLVRFCFKQHVTGSWIAHGAHVTYSRIYPASNEASHQRSSTTISLFLVSGSSRL